MNKKHLVLLKFWFIILHFQENRTKFYKPLIRGWKKQPVAIVCPFTKIKNLLVIELCYTVKPVLSNHINPDIFLAFQTGGCLLLHESSAESMSFLHYFHSAISNRLSKAISMSPEWMVAQKKV